MPLPESGLREEIHIRCIEMRGFRRADGKFEIDGRINDRKNKEFVTFSAEKTIAAGEYLHDMWVRVVIDDQMLVHEVLAVSDATPYRICPTAGAAVAALKGASVAAGWRAEVYKRTGGVSGCAHVTELLIVMGAAAFQTLVEARRQYPEPRDAAGVPRRIDSCYAFAREREVVARAWPAYSLVAKDRSSGETSPANTDRK